MLMSQSAVSLKRGRNFVRIGLDTRNCSVFSQGSTYLAEGSLRFTKPIPRVAPGTVEEEVDGVAEFNRGFRSRLPAPFLTRTEFECRGPFVVLPNWADLGSLRPMFMCRSTTTRGRPCGGSPSRTPLILYHY